MNRIEQWILTYLRITDWQIMNRIEQWILTYLRMTSWEDHTSY
ncbi:MULTISPECIES: hypothetical protein [Pseudoalteromonas]|nr:MULTISPECIES: hypothetical protein [Pseudoalteromonas]